MRPLLRLRDVETRYGRFVALSGVSLVVPSNSVVALLGANGAGKSTLLRTISGMIAPSHGSIHFDSEPIHGLRDHEIARRGLVHIPEGRGIFPTLTVRENLTMVAYGLGLPTRAVEGVYEIFPILAQRRDLLAGSLSGGEQQMLSVARALVREPRLLAIDELSLGLAPRVVAELYAAVERMRAAGVTILLVEQYVKYAMRLADLIVILSKGRIRFIGEPGELARNEELVASYLGQKSTTGLALAGGK